MSRAAQKEEKETMEETKTDKQKFEIPKNFKPVQIKNQLPDEPKSSNDKKD
ncbi:MAG: hypothetical protein IPN36_14770 [Bacteroidetes bacterium]|nr:hypothetical protein [Bacteroidota bacterium]